MTKDRFFDLMRTHVRDMGGAGRTIEEIEADIIAEDPGYFSSRTNLATLRTILRDVYRVPESRATLHAP